MNNENQDNKEEHVTNEWNRLEKPGEVLSDKEFEFMKEKIKERPINKKKLLRRTIITASLAVVFGLIACVTFLLLEPVFSNWLYPEEPAKELTFQETDEEMLPEDMVQDSSELAEDASQEAKENTQPVQTTVVEKVPLEIEDYQLLYTKLTMLAKETTKSMVTVEGATSDVDWFNNTFESKDQTSGLILADNGKELLILVEYEPIAKAETIKVKFSDGEQVIATMKKADPTTGLAIVAVSLAQMKESTRESIVMATLGSSTTDANLGSTIIALGSPMGYSNSVSYGMITSTDNKISVVDNEYELITTDIYGSQSASGILVNMDGEVIGIINQSHVKEDMKNMVAAIGISELRATIEKLSNAQDMAYLGISGTDVTKEANEELDVPKGAYVTDIVMESPAMLSGIQNGDVIVKIGSTEITSFRDYVNAIYKSRPDDETKFTVMRQGKNGYQEMSFTITLGILK